MSWKCSFFPARQSLQNQLPSGISMFRQSGWKAAGQASQQRRLPPTREQASLSLSHQVSLGTLSQPVTGTNLMEAGVSVCQSISQHPMALLYQSLLCLWDPLSLKAQGEASGTSRVLCAATHTAEHILTFGAHEAPTHIDVGMVSLPLPSSEMGCADDVVRSNHWASCCQTGIPSMIGNGAADTSHHFT